MSIIWEGIQWKDTSNNSNLMYEASLLKLNCDKALNYLNWTSKWDLNKTIKETVRWYKVLFIKENNMQEFS